MPTVCFPVFDGCVPDTVRPIGIPRGNTHRDMRANASPVIMSPPARGWSMIRLIRTVFHSTT